MTLNGSIGIKIKTFLVALKSLRENQKKLRKNWDSYAKPTFVKTQELIIIHTLNLKVS